MTASLKKRYFFKLMNNLVGLFVGILTQSIVPRALGPAAYGNFSFLTDFFWQAVGFLNLNSSTFFYTKLSQQQTEKGLINYYSLFLLSLGIVLCLFIFCSFVSGFDAYLWPEQVPAFVLMAAIWAFLRFNNDVLILVSDALGLTVKSELAHLIVKISGVPVLLLLFWSDWINLTNYFFYTFLIIGVSIFLLFSIIQRNKFLFTTKCQLNRFQAKAYTVEFYRFCSPLVVFTGISTLQYILDRWFLQKFSGSTQQGFYGLAYQIGAICFLFVSAMIPLVMREYAIAFKEKDRAELRRLFSLFCPMLYSIAAYFGCFIAVEAEKLILIFGGQAYSAALVPITIMCFYPIHQTYGQLNASFFYATSRTKTYRNIGIFAVISGLPLTFFLLGPKTLGGLQAGATGLAIKMVLIQIVAVNVQLWYNSRLLKLSFARFCGHQIIVPLCFLTIAIIGSYSVAKGLPTAHFIIQFIVSGFIYTISILLLLLAFPRLMALTKADLAELWRNISIPLGFSN